MINVTEQDYELLSRYLDQELPSVDRELLDQRLEAEPELAAELAGLQALQGRLNKAYSGVDGSIPQRIVSLLRYETARIVPLPRKRLVDWGFALAASVVVAASATLITQWSPQSAQPAGTAGAEAMLALALENSPSRGSGWETLADGRNVRPVLSFQSNTGNWCREYLIADSDGSWHAVACRGDSGWVTKVRSETDLAGSAQEYRPAGAMDTDEVSGFISLNAADIPLDAGQEAELIDRKWQ